MRTRKSNFVTKTGLIFLTAVVLIAAYFKYTELTAFGGLVLFFSLCAFLWAEGSVSKICVKCSEDVLYAFPDEDFDLHMSLENQKVLLLMWLDLNLPLERSRCIGKNVTEFFSWVMPWQTIEWRMKVPAAARGTARLDRVLLCSGDGFGLDETEKESELSRPVRLIVYPKVHPIDPSPLLRNMSEPEPSKNGILTDRTMINNIRPYEDGDNFRDINWRMMARSGEPYVNIHEKMAMRRVCLIPDLKSFSYEVTIEYSDGIHTEQRVHEEKLEEALSAMASYIAALHEHDILCTLVIPSYNNSKGRIIVPETPETQIVELLSALAEIDYRGGAAALPEVEMEEVHYLLGQIYRFDYLHGLTRLTGGVYEEIQ